MQERLMSQYRRRLTDMRLEINRIIDNELSMLDEDELRKAKEGNGIKPLPSIDGMKKEEQVIPIEVIINKGEPERD